MERITLFRPAYDKRTDDPKTNYGIHCVQCFMVLKGEKGAVHFTFSTGMFLKHVHQELCAPGKPTELLLRPMGYDVGYHSLTPQYPNQELSWPTKMKKTGEGPLDVTFEKVGDKAPDCEWLGQPCYCDGSAMRAEEWMEVLLTQGSDKIWEMLEAEYNLLFN